MNLSEPFIRRPVMTTMVTAALLLFGLMAYRQLPISDLPDISFPVITVTVTNPGMDPETMANNVAVPLEQQLMTIPGIKSVISSSRQGNTTIVVQFDLSKDIDQASTDVNSAINNASGNLPPLPAPPSYKKFNPADTPVIYVAVTSEAMTMGKLYDYGYTIIAQRLSMLSGVSEVSIWGSKSNVRVKVSPDKLAAMNIGINEIAEALVDSNQSLPGGTVYDASIAYTIVPKGQVTEGAGYNQLIVAENQGNPVYVKDIGEGVDSIHDEGFYLRYWDKDKGEIPAVIVAVTKEDGANTVKLCNDVRDYLTVLEKQLPASIHLDVIFDRSIMIKESINDVLLTLVIAFILVVSVIFLFLGKASSTIIPSISLPVSIFGTFAFMYARGFSIDILSMLGLTLVIGFLVDDAIVVLENIVRHQQMGKNPVQAALDGSKEISTTVLSMTLSLSAVFLPLVLMPGIIGRLFHEMAVVVVASVLISGSISLILTPMLCSRFLVHTDKKSRLEEKADRLMERLVAIYEPALIWVMRHRLVPILLGVASVVFAALLFKSVPTDFLPPGDTGAMLGVTLTSEEVSYDAMANRQDKVNKVLENNPYVDKVISMANFPELLPPNEGVVFAGLVDLNKRPAIAKIKEQIDGEFKKLSGIQPFLKPIPQINLNVSTSVDRADYSYAISGIGDQDLLYAKVQELTRALQNVSEITDVSSDLEISAPQVSLEILRDRASMLGVSVKTIEQAIQLAYSGSRISTFQTPINIYDLVLQVDDESRQTPDMLDKIRVSSSLPEDRKTLIPLSTVVRREIVNGPLQVNHINQLPSATVYFNIAPGAALSSALQRVSDEASKIIPKQFFGSFAGQAAIFQGTGPEMAALLLISILIIYLLLGSLYENFFHPLTILTTLPGSIFGGLLTLFVFQSSLSLYAFVGMIVLIGIVLKNGIMLVEFANEKVLEGKEVSEAIIEACKVRFRPILMTTIAAAMGALPIAIGIGADASSRRSMGLIILGGLLFAQMITYFFTPVICYYSMRAGRSITK
ncbi:multidrug resistance protein MdtC [Waddlia chondrophila 2032/99]|uniref:Multidrug resistance protein MdtC n=1 Tax=Waddlia chondrophila 2032/99 TaxID=765953 RepID=F8LEM2_9BACT|nr:multidrug resistance protein MdtC [Waddlia chondrophila 2032/99]